MPNENLVESVGNNISSSEADWTREHKELFLWCPSKSLLASIRAYERLATKTDFLSKGLRKLCVIRHRFWSVVTGADIPINCKIGGGLLLPHPNGIVIHPDARVGPNCLIFQQVTIGTRGDGFVPNIGGHVDIGAGAKILGGIAIGDHATIGANAVVLCDVPAKKSAVGVPARIRDNSSTEI